MCCVDRGGNQNAGPADDATVPAFSSHAKQTQVEQLHAAWQTAEGLRLYATTALGYTYGTKHDIVDRTVPLKLLVTSFGDQTRRPTVLSS